MDFLDTSNGSRSNEEEEEEEEEDKRELVNESKSACV